jgi:hypothetical protein
MSLFSLSGNRGYYAAWSGCCVVGARRGAGMSRRLARDVATAPGPSPCALMGMVHRGAGAAGRASALTSALTAVLTAVLTSVLTAARWRGAMARRAGTGFRRVC